MTEAAPVKADPATGGRPAAAPDPGVEKRAATRAPRRLRNVFNLEEFEAVARRHLPRGVFGYVAGAADAWTALGDNRSDFAHVKMMPRVLVGHATRDQATTLFGARYNHPFGIAPMGLSALAAYDGDVVLARAAHALGIPAVMSATSLTSLERVANEGPSRWYQAYLPGDDERIVAMVDRIAAAGYEVLVMTADVPVAGNREDSKRDKFGAPLKPSLDVAMQGLVRPAWLWETMLRTLRVHGMPHFENNDVKRGPPIIAKEVVRSFAGRASLSWHHAQIVRERFKGKVVIKGIIAPEDAARAAALGMDGIIVSNHGGRQLDSSLSSIAALPAVKAAAGNMTVMLDSGVRRGSDVLKAMALGADFVFVGRPFLFAAAVSGVPGVEYAASLLSAEIDRDMAMLGLGSLDALDENVLAPAWRPSSDSA
ncbi:alpha-hydroxy acid oxidase [Acuticoccus sp. MNP-M23]|uniref:alpha-hydroxy acid oxidase n=1 Tax=Acuticoccus sp. MNP-M23 TaxID=3072793 RepID=UPI002816800F|nr:alpha-hydroxy acid oxidase [Acuticoccus sp. MNP-M23]WMS44681.1 alpha-hydroxy acid oxidase [Acuticoccus sp. MNP-M23]